MADRNPMTTYETSVNDEAVQTYKRQLNWEHEAWPRIVDDNFNTPETRSLARMARHCALAFGEQKETDDYDLHLELELDREDTGALTPRSVLGPSYVPGTIRLTYKHGASSDSDPEDLLTVEAPHYRDKRDDDPAMFERIQFVNGQIECFNPGTAHPVCRPNDPGDWVIAIDKLYDEAVERLEQNHQELNDLEESIYELEGEPLEVGGGRRFKGL